MRDYVPVDDGWEPTDFDGYYDVPAQTKKDVATRVYITVERDPKKAVILEKRQNEAIIQLLKWTRDYRAQLADQECTSEDSSAELTSVAISSMRTSGRRVYAGRAGWS